MELNTVDVICAVLPGVTGGGRILRGIAKSDDVVDAANTIYKTSNKASDLRRMAFIDEYKMQKQRGVLSSNRKAMTYNKIWSPGRKYYYQMYKRD